jgi:hypothetical protein
MKPPGRWLKLFGLQVPLPGHLDAKPQVLEAELIGDRPGYAPRYDHITMVRSVDSSSVVPSGLLCLRLAAEYSATGFTLLTEQGLRPEEKSFNHMYWLYRME